MLVLTLKYFYFISIRFCIKDILSVPGPVLSRFIFLSTLDLVFSTVKITVEFLRYLYLGLGL